MSDCKRHPATRWQAVEDKTFEPNQRYPEFNSVVVEIDENGCKNVVAKACNAETASRIAAALFNCGYE